MDKATEKSNPGRVSSKHGDNRHLRAIERAVALADRSALAAA
ncbi:hypothetical protein [Xanthomonas euvesicatoria]|nr:hypothetical protein [Xanthomonas euvesicatoria]